MLFRDKVGLVGMSFSMVIGWIIFQHVEQWVLCYFGFSWWSAGLALLSTAFVQKLRWTGQSDEFLPKQLLVILSQHHTDSQQKTWKHHCYVHWLYFSLLQCLFRDGLNHTRTNMAPWWTCDSYGKRSFRSKKACKHFKMVPLKKIITKKLCRKYHTNTKTKSKICIKYRQEGQDNLDAKMQFLEKG